MFFEQLIVGKGLYLIPYSDLKHKSFGSLSQIRKLPNWYFRLQQKVIDNPVHTNRLLPQFASNVSHLSNFVVATPNQNQKRINWTTFWDNTYQQIIIGRSIKISTQPHLALFHHFQRQNLLHDPRSPSKKQHTYTACPGCHNNSDEDKLDSNLPNITDLKCAFYVNCGLLNIIDVNGLKGTNNRLIDRIYLTRSSLFTLSDQSLFLHNKFYKL